MNTYPLTVIERLIHDELPKQPRTYKQFYASIIKELENEINRIMKDLPRVLSTKGTYEAFEIYLQSIQQGLLLLMEKVVVYIPGKELVRLKEFEDMSKSKNGNMIIYNRLERLLSFLESQFQRYMNMTYLIPRSYFLREQRLTTDRLRFITQTLTDAGIDSDYFSILLHPLHDFHFRGMSNYDITYRQLNYLIAFREALMVILFPMNREEASSKLHDLLLYLNFNGKDYVQYLKQLITDELAMMPTAREKLAHLYFWEKKVSQQGVKEGLSYLANESSLKQQMGDWITGEIKFIKQHEESNETPALTKELARFLNFKIRVNLSINQVSYLLDIAYESGIFDSMKKTEILEFIAYFISTKKKDHLAVGSLRNKMYKPADSVIKSVKNLLTNLLNITERDALY